MKTGGIGASLSATISESLFDELDHEVIRLSSQDVPTSYAFELEAATIVQPEDVSDDTCKFFVTDVENGMLLR